MASEGAIPEADSDPWRRRRPRRSPRRSAPCRGGRPLLVWDKLVAGAETEAEGGRHSTTRFAAFELAFAQGPRRPL